MFRKVTVLVFAVGLLGCMVAGCAGETGKGEGEGCSSDSDCGGMGLVCQPVSGHGSSNYCCPSPLKRPDGSFSSGQSNCQPSN